MIKFNININISLILTISLILSICVATSGNKKNGSSLIYKGLLPFIETYINDYLNLKLADPG